MKNKHILLGKYVTLNDLRYKYCFIYKIYEINGIYVFNVLKFNNPDYKTIISVYVNDGVMEQVYLLDDDTREIDTDTLIQYEFNYQQMYRLYRLKELRKNENKI